MELSRTVGLLGFVLAAVILNGALERSRQALADWTVAAAAVTLVVHAQIEMTFFDPGSVTWMMCVLGLAGGAGGVGGAGGAAPRRAHVIVGAGAGALLLGAAVALSLGGAARSARAESLSVAAAKLIVNARGTEQQAWARQEAAGLLEIAWREHVPADTALVEQAARQLLMAAQLVREDERQRLVDAAVEHARQAAAAGGRPSSSALLAEALNFKAALSGESSDWQEAFDAARQLAEMDPHGIAPWRKLGDVLWAGGRPDDAAAAYERALRNDGNFALDPMRQLSSRDRGTIQDRIAEARR
jgi:tetratricopeptide (TPR) repeat protein